MSSQHLSPFTTAYTALQASYIDPEKLGETHKNWASKLHNTRLYDALVAITTPSKLLFFGMLIGLILLHPPALAQSPAGSQKPRSETPPSAKQIQAARENFLAGRAKLKDEFFELAWLDFKLADAVMGVPTTRLGVAEALVGMGRLVEARRVAKSVEAIPPAAKHNKVFAAARTRAKQLTQALNGRIPQLTITWPVDAPSDLAIILDDRQVNTARPLSVSLEIDPGKHTVRAHAADFKPFNFTFDLTEGDTRTVKLRFTELSISKWTSGANASTLSKSVKTESELPLWPMAMGSGLTLAAVGLGTGMWLVRQSAEAKADSMLEALRTTAGGHTPCYSGDDSISADCYNLETQRRRGTAFENISIASFITGGITAVATLGYLVGYTVSTNSSDESANGDQGTSARVQFTPSSVTLDVSF